YRRYRDGRGLPGRVPRGAGRRRDGCAENRWCATDAGACDVGSRPRGRAVEGLAARLSGRCVLMWHHVGLVLVAAFLATVVGVFGVNPAPAADEGASDDGQVIVTPTDP